jgi:hypothetical protein
MEYLIQSGDMTHDELRAENARLRVQIQQLTGGAADLQRAIEDPDAMCLSDRLETLERQRDRLLEALNGHLETWDLDALRQVLAEVEGDG